jgi:CheY-like chemotaxis protein
VLIASDSVGDADQLVSLLSPHFRELRKSVEAERAVSDFESFTPDVVVLAFDTLEKTQNYYLGLYRFSSILPGHPHRTVVLCTKDEVRDAFDLCVKRYFDDYVLYWPLAQDGLRLPMSVWIACRQVNKGVSEEAPQRAEWFAHARQMGNLDRTLVRELSIGANQIGIARESLVDFERNLSKASDEFSGRMTRGGPETGIEVKNPELLAREIERLKRRQIEQARQIRVEQVEPIGAWAQNLKRQVEPVLESTRALTESVRAVKPIVMVVDDDDLSQDLVARALGPRPYQLLFARDGADAFRELERVMPDAIFMDIRLPGMDGVALTRRLKASKRFAKIPIIMMTGDARSETLHGSIQAGAAAFVVKPFTIESLISKLEQVLPR